MTERSSPDSEPRAETIQALPELLREAFLAGEIGVWNILPWAADEIERLRTSVNRDNAQAAPATDEMERLRDLLHEARQYVFDAGLGCEDDNEVKIHSEALLAIIDQTLRSDDAELAAGTGPANRGGPSPERVTPSCTEPQAAPTPDWRLRALRAEAEIDRLLAAPPGVSKDRQRWLERARQTQCCDPVIDGLIGAAIQLLKDDPS